VISQASPGRPASDKFVVIVFWACAVVALLIHLLTNSRYGYFRDELYFIACARHLDWGYVDLAPLAALLLRLELASFGESLFAIRLFPALAGAATVALTALVFLAVGNFYSLNAFEPLFWMGCASLLMRIINGASGGFWLGIGLLAGLGLENKHSVAFFGAGLVLALLLTPDRPQFARRWIWLGGSGTRRRCRSDSAG
jgi:hypothetical protein